MISGMYSCFSKLIHPVSMEVRSYIINIFQFSYARKRDTVRRWWWCTYNYPVLCVRCGAQSSLRRTSPTARELMTHTYLPISLQTITVISVRKPLRVLYPGCGEPAIMPLTGGQNGGLTFTPCLPSTRYTDPATQRTAPPGLIIAAVVGTTGPICVFRVHSDITHACA